MIDQVKKDATCLHLFGLVLNEFQRGRGDRTWTCDRESQSLGL